MKILTQIECISENAIFMHFYVTFPDIPSFMQLALTVTRNNGGLLIMTMTSFFQSFVLVHFKRIIDTMRLMLLF